VGREQFNLAIVHDTLTSVLAERECVVWRDRRLTYADVAERSARLAAYLHARGLGVRVERDQLANHESGQDHVGLYLYNGNEYLEAMLGCYKARVAPFNVNYRYVEEELRYLLADARARGIVYHATFAPTLARVLPDLPQVEVLVQVADGSGNDLLPGAVDYEAALARAPEARPPVTPSPDDLYILYTGGTTGLPKGVLWRQHDIYLAAMGGRTLGTWDEVTSYAQIAARAEAGFPVRLLLLPPLMHGAAQWAAFIAMGMGGTIVLPDAVDRLDAPSVLRTIEREQVNLVTVVGDAIARPLMEEMETGRYDLRSLIGVGNGGAPMSPGIKQRLLAVVPTLLVSDSAGASETGAQMTHVSTAGSVATGTFAPGPGTTVLDDTLTRELEPGDTEIGWLAQGGAVPLGYLGDPDKTARTFPTAAGARYAVPGDRARRLADGTIELLGRDAVTINSGGEKIFAEEVEQALLHHPAVADVVVAGRPSARWGSEVVAVVQLAPGADVGTEELLAEAGRHIARYKLPKAFVFVDRVERSPSGKADYRWARQRALEA